MGLKKVYWITLCVLVKRLAKYWYLHSAQMPADFPNAATTWLGSVAAINDELQHYDKTHPRGK